MNDTLFYVLGSSLAALAVLTSFVGLRTRRFPGSTGVMVVVIGIFVALVLSATTFAVLNGQDEGQARGREVAR